MKETEKKQGRVCWICENSGEGEFVVLKGENHSTWCCKKCIEKLKVGKELSYKKIL